MEIEETEQKEEMEKVESQKQLEDVIRETIQESISESIGKMNKKRKKSGIVKILIELGIVALAIAGLNQWWNKTLGPQLKNVEAYDTTLANHGIFGFKAVDFEEAILGYSSREKLLIVEEQEASVNATIANAGFMNLSVFNKQQILTIHGMGQYTVDLSDLTSEDVTLNEDTFEVTIRIPHTELHQVSFDPEKTEVGDTSKGWFAFGDIALTAEENKKFETEAVSKLEEKLSEDACFEEADRFAKVSVYETYQPIISKVSPAYKLVVEFKEEA